MLIRFSVKNFRSFDDEVLFSMIPGRVQKYENHVSKDQLSGFSILRIALLYGANASGKSNFIRAMYFAQNLILKGTRSKQSISTQPFNLVNDSKRELSQFEFEFVADGQAYAYGFSLDESTVHEEWLFAIKGTSEEEETIFERVTSQEGTTEAKFGGFLQKDLDQQFLGFVTRGTRPNQLLFTELIDNNIAALDPIDHWFRNILVIIFPNSKFNGTEVGVQADHEFAQALGQFLHNLHTGVDEVRLQRIEIESLDIPTELLDKLKTPTTRDEEADIETATEVAVVLEAPGGRRFMLQVNRDGDTVEGYSLATVRKVGKKEVVFDIAEESDGTQRLFDLFPVLHSTEDKVFVIDELERSLHPNLVRRFIEEFLNSNGNNQLIVTTHESTLLDLSLLRRDEIWFVEKTPDGASRLYSLEEYKTRHDLDIRKGYLLGRFGAIPVFGSSLTSEDQEE